MVHSSARASLALIVALAGAIGAAQLSVGCSDDAAAEADGAVDGGPRAPNDASDAPFDGGVDSDAATDGDAAPPAYDWNLPPGFPLPVVPADNPMTKEKVELGRRIFYDKRLSKNQTQSCASCHEQKRAFTDGLARSVGSTGIVHPRNSMSIVNVAYTPTLTWANPLQVALERQAQTPIFGLDPVELGTTDTAELEGRFKAEPLYVDLFSKAFPGDGSPITLLNLLRALASFERTIISGRSGYDRWAKDGDQNAISLAAKRGYALFNGEAFDCFHCHLPPFFSDHVTWVGKAFVDKPYHNTGLYNVGGTGAYPAPNTGVESITLNPNDMGRFKVPSLRNVAVTAPYMHDGSVATLEDALDNYIAGGRTIASGPNAGNGSLNPFKDPLVRKLDVTIAERNDLIEFLKSLTDDELLTNPALSDPWPKK